MNVGVHPAMQDSEVYSKFKNEFDYYDKLHSQKYRDKNQTRRQHVAKMASNFASDDEHAMRLMPMLYNNRFLPAGRIQAALGAVEREVSPFNCSVSQKIEDNIDSIYDAVKNAAKILRLGTGIGYNFSHIRPKGALVKKLQTEASGPISYMEIFEASAATIASSGHRRGAQMGILNVNHPDIEAFIDAKMTPGKFRHFNLSVGVTDEFMKSVEFDLDWVLNFNNQNYKTIKARYLWDKIVTNAYNSAEPGVIFIDALNNKNNLWYVENIEATNPCAEQPLPPYGLCTLGSFNYAAYIYRANGEYLFNSKEFKKDIHDVVEAYDNVFDNAVYAIPEHKQEALSKRRIGLGATGIASAIELMIGAKSYGNDQFCEHMEQISSILCHEAYRASIELAKERGPFPYFDKERFCRSEFVKTLPADIQEGIYRYGIRNSHLVSYAPCGTISQCAANVSSGVEPVFFHEVKRDVHMREGKINISLMDFNYRHYNFKGKTLDDCSVSDHLKVAAIAQKHCDSAVSKTINVASTCPYEDYKTIYENAWKNGNKGITVFKPNDITGSVIVKNEEKPEDKETVTEFRECASGACSL